MDDVNAVHVARGKLEKRRQEAYRARAAATVKIQRWYRRRRDGNHAQLHLPDDISSQPSTEGSCTDSTSATISITSEQQTQGTLQDTGNIKSLNGAPYPHNGWTSKAYQHERSKSFDKFVNDEVAVAKAMLDDSYMDKLNDAQRKRVERLKAYRKDPPESKPSQATLQGDTSHVSTNQPPRMMHESSSLTREEAGELARERNANVEKTVRKGKRSIPVRTSEKQQQDLDTRGLKSEKVRGEEESRSNQGRSRVATEHGSVEKCVNNAQLRNGSKQKLSKPTTHQKVQAKMKGQQFVPKLPETKDPRRIEQATLKDMTIPHPNAKGAVKIIGSECKTEKDNGVKHEMTMDDLSRGHIPSTDTMLSSSCSDSQESQAIGEPKDVQEANEQAGTREEETKKPSQQGGQKVLKFASKVMCRSAATSTDSHQPHKPSIDDGLEQPFGVKREQEKDTESDLAPLKRSSATTRLILHREIRDEIETLMRDSASFLSQVKNSKHSSPKRQKRRLRSASVDDSDNLNTFNASPEHSTSAYTAAHKTPTQGMSLLTRHITQGGGYTVAYVKRKASNKKRIIRSLRSPQCKPMERKQPTGYLQKFLRSTEVQSFAEDLQNSEHLSISETWYSAWSSMPGGLPDWSNPDREMYSPPPRDWESVMASVARMNSVSSLGRRPHHLRPLVAPTGHKHLTPKTGHRKSYSHHQPRAQPLRSRTLQLAYLPQQYHSNHRRSQSNVMTRSWRKEFHYDNVANHSNDAYF